MIAACSSCDTRFVAESYRDAHCPTCGAIARQAAVRPCPRCELPLAARDISDVVVDECSKCNGVFLDHAAIKLVIEGRDRAELVLAALPRHEFSPLPKGKMYVPCPCCTVLMNRKLFATGSGVVVDVCRNHGMFFDAGELPAIIDFVMQGGLAKAAERDAARQREAALRAKLAHRDPPRGKGDAFVDFLLALF